MLFAGCGVGGGVGVIVVVGVCVVAVCSQPQGSLPKWRSEKIPLDFAWRKQSQSLCFANFLEGSCTNFAQQVPRMGAGGSSCKLRGAEGGAGAQPPPSRSDADFEN